MAAGAAGSARNHRPGQPATSYRSSNPPASTGSAPVEVARRYLGVPYVFGGSNPATGLDCSGLVQLVFRQLGITLPRTAQLQYEATVRVPQDQLQPGDLVFFARTYADPHDFITHVGIYIGGGLQINAPDRRAGRLHPASLQRLLGRPLRGRRPPARRVSDAYLNPTRKDPTEWTRS